MNGVLLSTKKADQVRKELIERDQFKIFNKALLEVNDTNALIISNQQKQVNILVEQNTKLVNEIEQQEGMTNLQRTMWFGLGVLATGLSVYGASLLVK